MNRITVGRSFPPVRGAFALGVALLALLLALGAWTAGCGGDGSGTSGTTDSAGGSSTSSVTSTTSAAPTSTPATASTLSPAGDSSLTTVTYAPPYTGTTLEGVPLPPLESNALAKELKRTSLAAAQLAAKMEEAGTPQDDPAVAVIYALRARAQALTARRAIVDSAMPLADLASGQIGRMLARAAAIAEGDTASAIAEAQGHLKEFVPPSTRPVEAASALDYVIRDLAPLVPAGSPSG